MIFLKNAIIAIRPLCRVLFDFLSPRSFTRTLSILFVLVIVSLSTSTAIINFDSSKTSKVEAATSSTINFQARLRSSGGNVVPDGNYHIELKLYDANNTTGSSQGSCSGDSNCLWTETRTTGNLVRVVNGYLTVNLGSVTAFPSTINWDQEHWLGMRIGGSGGSASWETIELTSDGTATGGKLKLTAVPYALRAGGLQATSGSNALKLNLATPTANVTYTLQDAAAGSYDICTTATICSGYASSSGSGAYIQNGTSLQATANFNIQSAGASSVGGIIRGAVSQTADLFQLQDSNGVILTAFDASGKLVFGPSGSQDTNLYRSAADTLRTDDNLVVGGTSITGTGSLTVQAADTNTLTLNTAGAGTVNVGTSNSTTVGVGNTGADVTIQGSGTATAVNIQAAGSGSINIGTNAVVGKIINIGSVGSNSENTVLNIANSTGGVQTISIGSTNTTSPITLQAGSGGVTVKTGGSAGSATAYRIQNAAGTSTYFQISNASSSTKITIGGNNSGEISTWTTTTSLPASTGFMGSSTVAANGYIYAVGGDNGSATYYSTVYYTKIKSDGSLDSAWTTNANALPAGTGRHAVVAHGGYIYLIGGLTSGGAQSAVYYAKLNTDGSTGKWVSTTSMPSARYFFTASVANGYVYVMGDAGGNSTVVNYAKLNPDGRLGAWQTASALPAGREDATSVVANGYIYLLGGNKSGVQSTVYYAKLNLDGTLGAWGSTTSMSQARYHHTSVVANGYVYVTGGYNGSSHATSTLYAPLNFDGTIGSWSTANNALPASKSGASSAVYNGYIYHLGGGAYQSTTAYYTSIQRVQVGGALDLVGLGGKNLADGETGSGGELTAGNTNIVGSLKVQGPASFSQSLNVDGSFSAKGDVSLGGSPKLNAWASTSSLTTGRRLPGAIYGNNGYVYAVGGWNGGYLTTTEYAKVSANGTIGAWASTTSMGTARQGAGVVVANGYVYAIGGTSGSDLSSVEYAKINPDGTLGTWATTSSLNTARSRASSIVANGYVYVIGGSGGSYLSSVEYAKINPDGTLGTWNTTSSLNTARSSYAASAANGYVYIVGGTNGSPLSSVEYASLNTNGTLGSWATTSSLNTARASTTSAISNGYIYAIGGNNGSIIGTVEYAQLNSNGTIGTWVNDSNSLGTARDDLVAVMANGYIYAIAGYSGSASSVVEYSSTSRVRIAGALDLVGSTNGNLANGEDGLGGQLTAGNTNVVGTLQVQGRAFLQQSLSVAKTLSVGGDTTIQNTSTTAFVVQSSSGSNLLIADTTNSRLGVGATPANSLLTVGTNTTAASGGITFGTDTNLYRSAADTLKTDDGFAVGASLDVTGSAAFKKGSDYSTTGTSNNVNFGEVSLVRLTGASAQTITGVANGRDGEILTIVNAAGQSATISDNSGSSSAANRIITGTGADITLPAGGSITLIYDSGANFWRVIGNVATPTGNFIQNGTSQQANANFNIQSASSGSIGGVIQGTAGQTADILQLLDEDDLELLSVGANAGFAIQSSDGFTSTNAFTVAVVNSGVPTTIFGVNSTTPGVYTGSASFNVFNDTATTINAFGAATTISLGAGSGTTTVNNNLTVTGLLTANGNLTLQTGDTFTMNGDAFTDLTGDGLTASSNALTVDTTSSTGFFRNGGNSFSGAATLGTNDANVLNFETAGTDRFQIASNGAYLTGQGNTRIDSTGGSLYLGSNGTLGGSSGIGIGTTAITFNAINIGSNGGNTVNIRGGGINIGASGAANTIQIGNTTGAVTQTINIGNNSTASSTNNVNIGSSVAGTVALQGATTITNRTSGSADTLIISNSTSTGNILQARDNATAVMTIANGGATTFRNETNSTAAFSIQSSGGSSTLLNADTTNLRITIGGASGSLSGRALEVTSVDVTTTLRVGDGTNGISFNDQAAGKLRFRGTAQNDISVTLSPEYAGAVLTGDGSNNVGTMTSDFCSGSSLLSIGISCAASEDHNYYAWTANATNDYDIWVKWKVPSDFAAFGSTPIQFYGWKTGSSDAVQLRVYKSGSSTVCDNDSLGSSGSWTLTNSDPTTSCSISAGDELVFRITLSVATNGNYAGVGEIFINYKSQF